MGVITKCCTRDSIISSSQISLYSYSDTENKTDQIKELPPTLDKNSVYKFIISDKYYSLISKNIPKHSLSEQLSKDMNISELIILMNELLKYIDNFESVRNNINIITIKNNAKCNFGFLLKEMKNNKYEEKNNYFMTRALSNMCLIIQSLLFLKNNDSGDKINEVYKVNIWKNKDIVKETKKYGYQGAFFILVYKNRKLCINSNETDKIKIKMELKQEINKYYKLSVDFYNDLINF